MAIKTHRQKTYTKPPKDLIDPGTGQPKFPPGHAVFQSQDGEGGNREMVVVFMGQTYNERGQWITKDPKKLLAAGYTVNQAMLNKLREGIPESRTRSCVSCTFEGLPMEASFCHQCGAPQPAKIVDPYHDDLTKLLEFMDPRDPFACLQPPTPSPERVTADQLMPTPNDIVADAQREKLPVSAEAVPGEGSRNTAPKAELNEHGAVGFAVKRK